MFFLIIPHLLEQFHLTVAGAVLALVGREPRPRHAARVDRLADRLALVAVVAVVERRRRRRSGRDDSVDLTDGAVLERLVLGKRNEFL